MKPPEKASSVGLTTGMVVLYFFVFVAIVLGVWRLQEQNDDLSEQQKNNRVVALRADALARDNQQLALTAKKLSTKTRGLTIRIQRFLQGKGGLKEVPGRNGIDGARGVPGGIGPVGPPGGIGQVGPPGPIGPQGITGSVGPEGTGSQGDIGLRGDQGEGGDNGPAGPQGAQGEQGNTGPTGPAGPQGTQGETGAQGTTGPQGPQGEGGCAFPITEDPGNPGHCTPPS